MAELVNKTADRFGRRVESGGDLLKDEVTVVKDSVKMVVNGARDGVNELTAIRPVKAVVSVVKGVVKGVANIPIGTVENIGKFAGTQGDITKEIVR